VAQKATAMAIQAAVLTITVAALVIIGRSFQLDITIANVASISAAIFLMGLDFGLLAITAGALTGRRGAAIGAGTALAAASYLISSLAPVASWIRPARHASLFYWSVSNSQISHGVSPGSYAVLIIAGLCALTAAMLAARHSITGETGRKPPSQIGPSTNFSPS
jgi:ABC-2 type transport system permease protein